MLCFNYTVGFSWSVAVLECPLCTVPRKDRPADAWQAGAHFRTSLESRCAASCTGAKSHSLFLSYRANLPTSLGRVIFTPNVSSVGYRMRLSVRCCQATHQLPFREPGGMHATGYPAALRLCTCIWSWALLQARRR